MAIEDSSNCPTHVQSSNPISSDPDTSGSLGPPAMASPAGDNSHLFAGVHFLLIGFDSVTKSQYRSKLVQSGGTDAMLFGGGCTHVVARGRVYDDPVCALARAQGSKVVSQIWLDDSLDRGVLADADRVIYWPARDLKGIPGSGSLQICLTGYQKKDREDIMKMVSLMGAQFSKRLLAPSVTHEGEKYKLAESLGIKIVNHRWLEDCLKSWEVLPVEDYSESGWILEIMEAQAKERLKFPIRDRLRAARRKRAVRKAKSSSKVRSSPGAPKPRPSRGGHRFLGVRRSSSRHPGPDRQIRRGRRSLCCLLLWQAQRRQAPAVVGVGAAPDEAAMI